MIQSIDRDGVLKQTKIESSLKYDDLLNFDLWQIPLPTNDVYLKDEQVRQTISRIRTYRKLYRLLFPVLAISGLCLITFTLIKVGGS